MHKRKTRLRPPLQGAGRSALAAWLLAGAAMPALAQSRGELLYTTHCIACHDTQLHWRDGKAATDWGSLMVQVQRWQDQARLGWTADDIAEVTRYLNHRYYRFTPPIRPAVNPGSRAPLAARAAASLGT